MGSRSALVWVLCVVTPLGLATKWYQGPGAWWVNGYAGDVLCVLFWITLTALLLSGCPVIRLTVAVLLATALVRLSQLWPRRCWNGFERAS